MYKRCNATGGVFEFIIFSYRKEVIKEIKHVGLKTNEELYKLMNHTNTVNCIKAQRLSWFGHIQRMPAARAAGKIFKWNALTARPRGRPKYRWEDNIIQGLGEMEIRSWVTCVRDRAKW